MRKHAYEQLESEIRKEKAEALGRAGERLEQILLDIEALRQEILWLAEQRLKSSLEDRDRLARDMKERMAVHARLCEEAKQSRLRLIIQREAVGLWRHEEVDRQYPVPRPLSHPTGTPIGEAR
jgi:hypothetical protein